MLPDYSKTYHVAVDFGDGDSQLYTIFFPSGSSGDVYNQVVKTYTTAGVYIINATIIDFYKPTSYFATIGG